ncbi:carotenoid cleavage dioxygenase [Panicum miliaceum]|uniref:Carotenoid cleavage dioxygenase n=1 Tax=Panicum miliaceum TaxID=4540 RepID=A0A3L6PVF1_PANMI|nr:carotenoid cleavage dioxygenase [Panicum miliaceum]
MHAVVHHHRAPPPHRCSRGGVRAVRASAATVPTTSAGAAAAAAAATDPPSAAFWDYNLLFRSQRAECRDPVPLRVAEGAIPPDFPAGTYYLAGPGMFADDHGSTVHPLDGHGYLRAFRFGGGGARYSARYVETAAKREEHDAGGASWSVLRWGGRVLCLWEGGEPYELHPRTLETLGPFDILGLGGDGAAPDCSGGASSAPAAVAAGGRHRRGRAPAAPGVFRMPARRLLAHYKIDPERNRLLMVACNTEDMLLPRSNFTFYEFDADFALVQKREFVVPDHLMIHDWTFTDSHYVLLGNRIKFDVPGSLLALTGTHPMIAALAVDPSRQSTPVYLLPRSPEAEAGGRDWSVPVEAPPQMWSMHVGNAFEEPDARGGTTVRLHMSGCSYQWFHFHRMFGYNWMNKKLDPAFMNVAKGREWLPRLVQVSIDLDKGGACRGCSVRRLSDQWTRPADFPAINPSFANRRNRFVYAGAASGSRRFLPFFPFDSVVKVDVSDGSARLWSAAGRKFVGEPVFVPIGGREEDDGYVLLVEYAVSDHRCHLVVLDARRIGERNAVVAKLEVPKRLTFPMGFHGFWADE